MISVKQFLAGDIGGEILPDTRKTKARSLRIDPELDKRIRRASIFISRYGKKTSSSAVMQEILEAGMTQLEKDFPELLLVQLETDS